VRREGKLETIAAEEIVPGDIVVLESGDMVTADIRFVQAKNLFCARFSDYKLAGYAKIPYVPEQEILWS